MRSVETRRRGIGSVDINLANSSICNPRFYSRRLHCYSHKSRCRSSSWRGDSYKPRLRGVSVLTPILVLSSRLIPPVLRDHRISMFEAHQDEMQADIDDKDIRLEALEVSAIFPEM